MSPAKFTHLESPRVLLRRFTDADLEPFLAYRSDPEVARYQSWDGYARQEALDFIRDQQSVEPGTPGRWFQFALELKATNVLVGDCALKVHEPDARQGEIGFTLSRAYQGQGLAFEGVGRVLRYAFADLGLHRVTALTDAANAPSVALLERLGMRREGHFLQNAWFKGGWADEFLYALLRDEWLRRHGPEIPDARC
jgi:RimJ/RimL family protein N-acetyltransferase